MQSCPDETSGTGSGTAAGGPGPQGMVPPPRRSQALTLVIAVSLVVIAICLVLLVDQRSVVRAQPLSSAGARGVFAFTGQLTKGTYGVFMVDVDTATLWCYEYLPSKRELRLVAGRAWTYDRYLKNFNGGQPTPEEVKELVEQQRALELQLQMGTEP